VTNLIVSSPSSTNVERWSPARRAGFRFVFVYVGFYLVAQLPDVPVLDYFARAQQAAWRGVALWTAQHVLHRSTPVDLHTLGTGSGDTLLDYLLLLCQSTIALAVTALWTAVDRKRLAYPVLYQWLRVFIRYMLAGIMLSYGIAKVLPEQFGHPTLDRLIEPYGHSSPMGLLWTFMGQSRPYTVFTGILECSGALLLFSQRTTTLGALVVAAAMGNVAMLNFSYDVPVKLFSTQLFLLAIFLLLPDVPRLTRVFVTNEPAHALPLRAPFTTAWRRRAALALKTMVIVFLLWQTIGQYRPVLKQLSRPINARYGIYEVERFVVNGEPRPAVPMDAKRWRRVIINEYGAVTVQTMDDAVTRYRTKDDPTKQTFELNTIYSPYDKTWLTYRQPSPEELTLEGVYAGDTIAARLRKVPAPSFLLTGRGFHWINEYPYNR
jgi:hypothetical protein